MTAIATAPETPETPETPGAARTAAARSLFASLVRPTLPALWAYLAVALPVLAAIVAPLAMVDLAYSIRAGDWILSGQGIPTVDAWTYTVGGAPWLDQQWLAQLVLAGAFRVGGWTGLVLLRAVLVGAAFALLSGAVATRAPSLGRRSIALLVLAAFVLAAPGLALRPQLFAVVLFAATLWVLGRRRDHRSGVWLLPLIAIVWANVHGSFPLAIVLAGLAWVEDVHERAPRRHLLLLIAAVTALATLVNPTGADVWRYLVALSTNGTISARVAEWQAMTLRDPIGALFWLSAAAVVVLLARRSATTPWPALLALGAFAALAAWSGRGLVWWALVAAYVVAGLIPGPRAPTPARGGQVRAPRPSLANGAIAIAIALIGVVALPIWRPADPTFHAPSGLLAYAPIGAARQVVHVPAGTRLWVPQTWASWFELSVPQAKYGVDSRIELFPASVWADADAITGGGPDALTVLDRYGVSTVVTPAATGDPLEAALRGSGGWGCTYADEEARLWVRGGASASGC